MKLRDYSLPDWYMTAGETKIRTITLRDEETGEKMNLDGATAKFSVVDFVNYDTDSIVNRDITLKQDSSGKYCECVLALAPSETVYRSGKFVYQLNLTDGAGNVSKLRGLLYISPANERSQLYATTSASVSIYDNILRQMQELNVAAQTAASTATYALGNMSVIFTLLPPGSQPTSNYNAETLTLTIGIPQNIIYVTAEEYDRMMRAGTLDPTAYYAIGEDDPEE